MRKVHQHSCLARKYLQPGYNAMIPTTSTLGLASSLPSVDQRRGHIGRSQEPQSAFVCWPLPGGKSEVSTSCVSSSGPRGRLRGCHLNPAQASPPPRKHLERWLHLIGRRCRRHQARPGLPIPRQGFPSYKLASGLDRII